MHETYTRKKREEFKKQFTPNASRFSAPPTEFRSENTQVSSRVLAKISLELLYLYFPNRVFSSDFDTVRNYAIGYPECNVEFIPYAWKIHTGRPFIHFPLTRLKPPSLDGQISSSLFLVYCQGVAC